MESTSRLGGRGGRWGLNGCDWLAMKLEFAFGASASEIAERHDVSADTVKVRAAAESWRRDHSDQEMLEMMCSVQLGRVHAAMCAEEDGKMVSRSKSLRSLQLAAEAERAKAREIEAAGTDDGEQDDMDGAGKEAVGAAGGDGGRAVSDLRRRLAIVFQRQRLEDDARGYPPGLAGVRRRQDADGGAGAGPLCAVGS